ncbi:hypothetical protein AMES_7267 [Amycolatopsis mediterranei S699]|uniref:Uncharacterized protein n=2 Tax=Amycolatopsis mediterranei TaxID=33910 RepID=A0A0H3DFV9_AMYMU|nr:DUF6204 family protein [Amycolatopsis mediterranei]ADJ49092.1 conserved hypothetical protein [Amycolatopsis mediterranei U32]AEK46053.1 hypothetical protein RAM_37930 [Amycolatopsis mediterranei S699]AFO80800.1 hypothetical protein AMES_7267 [Amycolatopsis mediterranei S699]AGT87928.1 hypothetical protein B737_7267 [Amycolatopsis mediterranei RB]KDO04073.1 hypothetical protein DV26_46160 [Amycolatopsis mediterranei]
MPTYRVLVRGKFDRPTEAVRAKLLANAGAADLVFSETGALAYSRHLGGFSYRVVVEVEAGEDATQRAHDQAELMAMELLEREGYPYRDLTVSSTCMDDVKVNRR